MHSMEASNIMRPATRSPSPVAAVWRQTPAIKIIQPAMMVVRRPMKSAISPAAIAPRMVPADRIEVIRDLSCVGMGVSAEPVYNLTK